MHCWQLASSPPDSVSFGGRWRRRRTLFGGHWRLCRSFAPHTVFRDLLHSSLVPCMCGPAPHCRCASHVSQCQAPCALYTLRRIPCALCAPCTRHCVVPCVCCTLCCHTCSVPLSTWYILCRGSHMAYVGHSLSDIRHAAHPLFSNSGLAHYIAAQPMSHKSGSLAKTP